MTRLILAVLVLVAALPQVARADDRYYRDDGPRTLRCESRGERDRYCPADTRGGVRIVDQYSRQACVLGRTWGYDRGGVWVAHGCRARFEIGGGAYGRPGYGRPPVYGGGRAGYGYGEPLVVRCESRDGRSRFCPLPGGVREADIQRQLSRTPCDYGYSWGLRRGGIWVDRGCRADFVVY
ncbi:DUF3011 domain-containing protein [bacterium BD-1]|nr:DUF3011 domain-containing protein [Ottowia caeni]